jgi:hypothetical protein
MLIHHSSNCQFVSHFVSFYLFFSPYMGTPNFSPCARGEKEKEQPNHAQYARPEPTSV